MFKKILLVVFLLIVGLLALLNFYIPPVSDNHGKVQTELFLGKGDNQPLVIGFGGGEGGNAWASDHWKITREEFIKQGYAFLAVGYFGGKNLPNDLDRISLNAIHDSILKISKNPKINSQKIALIGGSKGAELVLNLASRYKQYKAVVGIVPCHVSFPATTLQALTSSWTFDNKEVPFVPLPLSGIPSAIKHDLHRAFSIMLEDKQAVDKARIEVEKINGPVLLISATNDEQWPSTEMSNGIIQRLQKQNFKHAYKHITIKGGHTEPLKHFASVFEFLNQHFKL